jgi:hypothetical protein
MDLEYGKKALREAERELEAATTRSAVNVAAKKVMRAKQELKWMEEAGSAPKRSSRATASAAASS